MFRGRTILVHMFRSKTHEQILKIIFSNSFAFSSRGCGIYDFQRKDKVVISVKIPSEAADHKAEHAYICFGCGAMLDGLRSMARHLINCREQGEETPLLPLYYVRTRAKQYRFQRDMTREKMVCPHCITYQTLESTAYRRHQENCAARLYRAYLLTAHTPREFKTHRGRRGGRGRRPKTMLEDSATAGKMAPAPVDQEKPSVATVDRETQTEPDAYSYSSVGLQKAVTQLIREHDVLRRLPNSRPRKELKDDEKSTEKFRNYNPLFSRYYSDNSEDDD